MYNVITYNTNNDTIYIYIILMYNVDFIGIYTYLMIVSGPGAVARRPRGFAEIL